LPPGVLTARWLARTRFSGKAWIEAFVVLPLVLPPTVLGYYLLVSLGAGSPLGAWMLETFDIRMTFNFAGLLIASLVFNIPFIV
ncbi:molybdate ABC transporter permease subunit, partial [Salmonella enterica subsp. enterica serovar Typhimurium]|nr:molybdate ABC transporter permease subunit [Salmonella enterica subsp. enterica serovar Typhimurium]